MSNPTTQSTTSTSTSQSPAPAPGTSVSTSTGGGALASSQGATHIAEPVVAKIAGLAARDVHGIHRLGGGAGRALGALRERIPGASTNVSQGVHVEVGEKQAAVDLSVVVEYGVAIADLAAAARRNVITALERMTGLEVVEVNISVTDVHLPSEDDDNDGGGEGEDRSGETSRTSSSSRVQ